MREKRKTEEEREKEKGPRGWGDAGNLSAHPPRSSLGWRVTKISLTSDILHAI